MIGVTPRTILPKKLRKVLILVNLLEYLNIQTIEKTSEKVTLSMEVESIHKQPYGIMHGGINAVLIETACSIGANEHLKLDEAYAVGVDLQVNHLKSVTAGILIITATPDHIGQSTQVWSTHIYNNRQLVSVGRCTLLNKKHPLK